MNNTPKTEEFERCVVCGALTCVPISMPVDWRENYEIGLGQICAACTKKQREATITRKWKLLPKALRGTALFLLL